MSTPFNPRVPFRLSTGLAAGYTDHQLRGPMFRRLFRDCFVSAGTPVTPALLTQGALLVQPTASFASHHTAAALLGGIVPDSAEIHLGAANKLRLTREGITVHRYKHCPDLTKRFGVLVTSAAQTFLDLSATLSLIDLVVLGDSLVKKGRVTVGEIVAAADDFSGRGARRAREAAVLVRAEVDSPQETRTRLLLVLAGLPEPTINIKIRDADGEIVRRLDMGYEPFKLAIEYDGRQHIQREKAWTQDLSRREDLENDAWRFVILVSDDIYVTPQETISRVVDAMRAVGMPVPRLRNDWMRHFPGRRAA